MVRAVFDFCPSVSEELPLFVGDIIEVLAVVDEFWLLGKKEDVTGERLIIPHVYNGPSLLSILKIKVEWEAQVNKLQKPSVFSICTQTGVSVSEERMSVTIPSLFLVPSRG